MNGKTFQERYDGSNIVEIKEKDMSNSSLYTDPYAGNVPIDVVPVEETPVYVMEAPVAPVSMPNKVETPLVGDYRVIGPAGSDHSNDDTIIPAAPMGATASHEEPVAPAPLPPEPLLTHEESEHFRTHWNEIQARFVDEPRAAVQQADALVSEVIGKITQMFANEHNALEGQWNQGNDVSTEDLRMSLQRYRSFFKRLVV